MSKPNEIAPWDFGADPTPTKPAPPPTGSEAQNITPREVVCDVEYTIPATGEVKTCAIILRILTNAEKMVASQQAAIMFGGQPVECFEPKFRARAHAWAHMGRLATKDWPKWLREAIDEDDGLLFALYEEALAHQARYFPGDSSPSEGTPSKPRMAIRARLPAQPASPVKQ